MENKNNRGREFSPDYKKRSPNEGRSSRTDSSRENSNRDGSFQERAPQKRFNPENREGGNGGGFRRDRGEGFKPREGGSGGGFRRDRGEGFKPREGGGEGGFRRDRGEGFKPREGGSGGGFRRDRGEGFKPREGGSGGGFRRDRGEGLKPREGGGEGGFRRDRGEGFRPREGGSEGGFRKKITIRPDASDRVDSLEKKEKRELFQSLEERKTPFFEKQPRNREEEGEISDKPLRINRFLAKCGLGARRNVEELIKKGRVSINGEVISSFSTKVNPLTDKVTFDGEEITLLPDSMILAFNKPEGYLCSHHDVHHEKTIFNLLPAKYRKFNMAGRLDLTSRGLMILSPNGDLLNNVTHPSSGLEKEYIVKVDSLSAETDLVESFLHGIDDSGEFLRAKEVEVLDSPEGLVRIVLKEGKKRQIHRMFQSLGSSVIDLQRVRIGNLHLNSLDLQEGTFKEIQEEEIFGE